jgi:hypothetical protein
MDHKKYVLTDRLVQTVTLLTCIREVPHANLSRVANYFILSFPHFFSLKANAGEES